MSDVNTDTGVILEALNDKADRDLNNINPSATAKQTIVGWGMPNYNTNVNITSLIPTSGSYKFSEKCFVFVRCVKESNSNATATLQINGVSYDICWTSANNQWREQNNFLLPLDVNDTLAHSTVGTWTFIKFSMKGIQ